MDFLRLSVRGGTLLGPFSPEECKRKVEELEKNDGNGELRCISILEGTIVAQRAYNERVVDDEEHTSFFYPG